MNCKTCDVLLLYVREEDEGACDECARDEYIADNRRLANRVGELEGWLHAAADEREAVERERDEARAEVAKLRALLGEVAQLGNVEHDPDGDCRGNWDDEPCDDDCHIADHNALMDQVRAVVATWQAT